jgi:hypothetical protein
MATAEPWIVAGVELGLADSAFRSIIVLGLATGAGLGLAEAAFRSRILARGGIDGLQWSRMNVGRIAENTANAMMRPSRLVHHHSQIPTSEEVTSPMRGGVEYSYGSPRTKTPPAWSTANQYNPVTSWRLMMDFAPKDRK